MMRMSQPSAVSSPYPAAEPFRAQIVGLSMAKRMVGGVLRRSRFTETRSLCEPMPEPWVASTRSRPAQKPRPAPVRITTRTPASALAFSRSSPSLASMGPEMAFIRSGRFSVIVATWSATS